MFSSSKQVIARLTPADYEAKHAYNDFATRIVDSTPDMSDFLHAAHFMVIKPHFRGQTDTQTIIDSRRGADDTGIDTESGETEAGEWHADPVHTTEACKKVWIFKPHSECGLAVNLRGAFDARWLVGWPAGKGIGRGQLPKAFARWLRLAATSPVLASRYPCDT
jgi:hypothetical protein